MKTLQDWRQDEGWFQQGLHGIGALLQGQGWSGAKAAMAAQQQNSDARTIQQIASRQTDPDLKQALEDWIAQYKARQAAPPEQPQAQPQPQQAPPRTPVRRIRSDGGYGAGGSGRGRLNRPPRKFGRGL